MAGSARKDQIVVDQLATTTVDHALCEIDSFDATEMNFNVVDIAKLTAYRHGDVSGIQASRRNLIEEWLKEVVVALIDHHHMDAGVSGQSPRCVETGKNLSDDYHGRFGRGSCRMLESHLCSFHAARAASTRASTARYAASNRAARHSTTPNVTAAKKAVTVTANTK